MSILLSKSYLVIKSQFKTFFSIAKLSRLLFIGHKLPKRAPVNVSKMVIVVRDCIRFLILTNTSVGVIKHHIILINTGMSLPTINFTSLENLSTPKNIIKVNIHMIE